MVFKYKVEDVKQYRQSAKNRENFIFFHICKTKISEVKNNDDGCSL